MFITSTARVACGLGRVVLRLGSDHGLERHLDTSLVLVSYCSSSGASTRTDEYSGYTGIVTGVYTVFGYTGQRRSMPAQHSKGVHASQLHDAVKTRTRKRSDWWFVGVSICKFISRGCSVVDYCLGLFLYGWIGW